MSAFQASQFKASQQSAIRFTASLADTSGPRSMRHALNSRRAHRLLDRPGVTP